MMTTIFPHQGQNSTTILEWKAAAAAACPANAVILASTPHMPPRQTGTTQSQVLKAAAAVAIPRSPT